MPTRRNRFKVIAPGALPAFLALASFPIQAEVEPIAIEIAIFDRVDLIAHELVHSIAPQHTHANEGMMLGSHAASSILDPELRIDAPYAAAFQTALDRLNSAGVRSRPHQSIDPVN